MDWRLANDEERAALKRIVALLFALADLAVLAGARSPAVRAFVLWLLLAAEAAARNLVTLAPAPCPFHHAGTRRADAMRLARRFRNLARALDRQADTASATGRNGIGQTASATLRPTPQRVRVPILTGPFVFSASTGNALGVAGFPDTS